MFDLLDQVREAWNDSRFILINNENNPKAETALVIPSQSIRPDHIAQMRINAGGLISCAIAHQFCSSIELPFLSIIYRGISARYPLITSLLKNGSNGFKSSFSISIDHINVKIGNTDNDRALTISSLGDIIEEYKSSKSDAIAKFSSFFCIPGHVQLLRASHDLLRRRIGHTELSLALCEIASQSPTTTICKMIDEKTGNSLILEDATKFAKENDFPLIDSKKIIHLWRSIKKVPKSEIYGIK